MKHELTGAVSGGGALRMSNEGSRHQTKRYSIATLRASRESRFLQRFQVRHAYRPSHMKVGAFGFDFRMESPQIIEPFVSGFLLDQGSGRWARFARPFGLVVAGDGSMLMGDEQNGIIYRISHVP